MSTLEGIARRLEEIAREIRALSAALGLERKPGRRMSYAFMRRPNASKPAPAKRG